MNNGSVPLKLLKDAEEFFLAVWDPDQEAWLAVWQTSPELRPEFQELLKAVGEME